MVGLRLENDLFVSDELTVAQGELEIATSRSGGPGGQHVQKTDSRITLRWNITASKSVSEDVRARLLGNLSSRLVGDGEIVLHVSTERSQIRNREIARERLASILLKALHVPKTRRKTQPSKGAKARRIDNKKRVSTVKKMRSVRGFDE
jgi:ribosome-associated protein